MIELKKSELESLLLTISTFSPPKEGEKQVMISGLLMENLTLGTKRKLQKIHKAALNEYTELTKDVETIRKECGEDVEKLKKELLELFNESVKLDAEPILFSFIEGISSTTNYNFDIIDKIAI